MLQNIMEQINAFLSTLKTIYNQQGQTGRILFPGMFLFAFCCLCSILFRLLPLGSRNASQMTPSPIIYPTLGTQATPTALFNFGATPFPTLVAPSPLPTTPAPSTVTPVPTPVVPTSTATMLPTSTNPPPIAASTGSILILRVNKLEEYVDLQNVGNGPVDLSGWKLVSETGNQACMLSGVLQPNETFRVWAHRGSPGFNCGYTFNIWNDNQSDPAVLYDPQGKIVSRYP